MRNPGRLILAFGSLLTVFAGTSVASASPRPAAKLTGYTIAEGTVSVPADGQASAYAPCPKGDHVVGGGGYEVTQNTEEDLNTSAPNNRIGWTVTFNNQASASDTGVAVAICVAKSSLADYSVQLGTETEVPANSTVQVTVTCPSGTVDLGGGWSNDADELSYSDGTSAPFGTNGWRAFVTTGPEPTGAFAWSVCAAQPPKWAQVHSSYVANPANTTTTVTVACPTGTMVLGGGGFNSSESPLVNIGRTSSLSNLESWSITEINDSSSSESVDAWAVCAKASSS